MKENNFNPNEILEGIPFEKINKHPNILIAAAFWEEDRYRAAKTCYRFMRTIDDMIDDRKANPRVIDQCEKDLFANQIDEWLSCLRGGAPLVGDLSDIVPTISKYNIPLELFGIFAKSMIYDIHNDGFRTFDSFLEYAEGASVAPASVFLHLCCLSDNSNNYAKPTLDLLAFARPCAIFSYIVHIIRDFEIDQKQNLNYFSLDLLEQNNLKPDDLKKMAHSGKVSTAFRSLIKTYLAYADKFRLETEEAIEALRPHLEPRYLLSLKIIFQLYLEIYNRIDAENGAFKTHELTPTPEETKIIVARIIEDVREK